MASGHGAAGDPAASRPPCRHSHALQIPQVTTLPATLIFPPDRSVDVRLLVRELPPFPPTNQPSLSSASQLGGSMLDAAGRTVADLTYINLVLKSIYIF